NLPPDLPAAVFVVLHVPAESTSVLPNILNRARTLPAVHPHDGQAIQPGRIYVAPPDFHLLIKDGTVRLTRGPRENRNRPAADPSHDLPEQMAKEADMAELDVAALQDPNRPGAPSVFGCPECGGVLWELQDGSLIHFRCRVGHAWSPDSLLAEQADALEEA